MNRPLVLLSTFAGLMWTKAADAAVWSGPGRFCGYSAVIDLLPTETITPGDGGIHGGSFVWTGEFGTLQVRNAGWAIKPRGRRIGVTRTGQSLFKLTRERGYAIWNRAYGSAYFSTPRGDLTKEQLQAIHRVWLFDEAQPKPKGCRFRTIFSLE